REHEGVAVGGGPGRHGELDDRLCDVEANQGIVHVGSSLYCSCGNDSGTVMPSESKEESIASMKLTKREVVLVGALRAPALLSRVSRLIRGVIPTLKC